MRKLLLFNLVFIFLSLGIPFSPNYFSHDLLNMSTGQSTIIKYKISWDKKANMPEARRNLKIAAVGNRIFALGGYAQPHTGREKGNFCYDIKKDSWSVKADMITGRSNFAIASLNGKLYTIGGDKFLDKAEVYNPDTDIWTPISPMPTARQHINCAVFEDKIYVTGGRIGVSENPLVDLSNSHEAYDIKKGYWKTLTPFPRRTENPSMSVVEGKLYVIDGTDRSVTVYNPEKDYWEERNKMPSVYFIAGSTVVDNKIFVLDGVRSEEEFSRLYVYDPVNDSWSEATPLPVGVKLAGFTSVDDKLYVIGGCDHEFTAYNYTFVGEIKSFMQ